MAASRDVNDNADVKIHVAIMAGRLHGFFVKLCEEHIESNIT